MYVYTEPPREFFFPRAEQTVAHKSIFPNCKSVHR